MPWAHACLSACGRMSQVPDNNGSEFLGWLNANGLNVPKDFKFAFTSAGEAAKACPKAPMAAAEAWKAISHNDVEVPSSWTLWITNRRCGAPSIAKQLSCPPVKLWRGLCTRRARADQGPANDSIRGRPAAKDALHVALSWKRSGRLAKVWCQTDPSRRDGWFGLQVTRIATTEARTIQSAMRTCGNTGAHGALHMRTEDHPSAAAPVAFLYAASTTTKTPGQAPRTLPTTRFNHLRGWIEANLGSPVILRSSDRPSKNAPDGTFSAEQHLASDPEVHMPRYIRNWATSSASWPALIQLGS